MTRTTSGRRAASIASVALALSIATPAASATSINPSPAGLAAAIGTPSIPQSMGHGSSGNAADPGYTRTSPAELAACNPLGPALEFCPDLTNYWELNASTPSSAHPATAGVATPGGGLDWGDAEIGAAAAILLLGGLVRARTGPNSHTRHAASS